MKSFNLKNILSSIHLPKRTEYRTISAKARHDWKFMVFGFVILSCVVVLGNLSVFWKISSGANTSEVTNTEIQSVTVSKQNLEDTVMFFKNRQARLEDLKTQKPDVLDPSL